MNAMRSGAMLGVLTLSALAATAVPAHAAINSFSPQVRGGASLTPVSPLIIDATGSTDTSAQMVIGDFSLLGFNAESDDHPEFDSQADHIDWRFPALFDAASLLLLKPGDYQISATMSEYDTWPPALGVEDYRTVNVPIHLAVPDLRTLKQVLSAIAGLKPAAIKRTAVAPLRSELTNAGKLLAKRKRAQGIRALTNFKAKVSSFEGRHKVSKAAGDALIADANDLISHL